MRSGPEQRHRFRLLFLGWLASLSLLAASCGSLPRITPPPAAGPGAGADWVEECRAVFPPRPWKAVHTLSADLPFGQHGAFIGVTAAPKEAGFRSVLLSVEGLALLDQSWSPERLTVHRALPPLDLPGIGAGMAADIRLLFFPPPGDPEMTGTYGSGERVCRFRLPDDGREDVVLDPRGGRRILAYDSGGRLVRQVRFLGPVDRGFSTHVELSAPGPGGYSLDLVLVEVQGEGEGEDGDAVADAPAVGHLPASPPEGGPGAGVVTPSGTPLPTAARATTEAGPAAAAASGPVGAAGECGTTGP